MKKFTLIVFFVIVGCMLLAVADDPIEKDVFAYEGDPVNARAFYSTPAGGSCNKTVWAFDIEVEAQIAQWISWSIGGTKWTWFVRKPGEYFADCIEFSVKSNSDVGFTFSGFHDLEYTLGATASVNPVIPVWYNFGSILTDVLPPNNPNPWFPAEELNNVKTYIEDSEMLHNGWVTKLWTRIKVVECNSASTYRATGKVTITLLNQKPWIIPETGEYVPDLVAHVK
ncbi:MAG: hypothetical protein JW697_08030 [Kosmotogaceae bacterium]|nr:hypothetical protein [Kosmotogaceae bacterium]